MMVVLLIKEAKGLGLVYIELVMNRTSQRSPSGNLRKHLIKGKNILKIIRIKGEALALKCTEETEGGIDLEFKIVLKGGIRELTLDLHLYNCTHVIVCGGKDWTELED